MATTVRRPDRTWMVIGVVVTLVIVAVAWFFFISPQLEEKSSAEEQLADTQTQNIVLQQRITRLRGEADRIPALQQELTQARAGLPADHRVEEFTRQITAAAAAVGVTITSISPAAPAPIIDRQPEPEPTQSGEASDETEGSSADEPAPAPTVPGPAGTIYAIAITVESEGPMDGQRAWLSALEKQGPRRALVVATTFTPGAEPDMWTLSTQLQIFVAPQSPDQEAALVADLASSG